jgi:glyoxylase-like metal-dependent hydrolase (beta-lactamase superfamily II)
VIIEHSVLPNFLTNNYLVADHEGGTAFFVDAGGPVEPLIEAAERLDVTPTHVLLTHAHGDHVFDIAKLTERYPGITVMIDPREEYDFEAEPLPETLTIGDLEVRALHTPGHTAGMQNLLVDGHVFTGDTLFKNSVGGVRGQNATSYEDIKASIMDVLMALPPETVVQAGHSASSTIGDEWEHNAFIRVWRGLDPEGDEPCLALGEPATLVLFGDDYDGGHKAWVRWPDGRDDLVPGSRVERS